MDSASRSRLATLVDALTQCGPALDADRAAALLSHADLAVADVAPYIEERADTYARRLVARTDSFELLVMTWRPGQASVPHDHAGSSCCMRVLRGHVDETRFRLGPDGLVGPESTNTLRCGDTARDPGGHIHSLTNAGDDLLVTLHVYTPPLPELRRYVPRLVGARPSPTFVRAGEPAGPTVVVVGGGFSGTMVAANLMRLATEERRPLHVILLDRHSSFGEGPAYRTVDARHLLNVPAAKMSAWAHAPQDFLEWARARDPLVDASTFLPRRLFGEYVRATFMTSAAAAGAGITAEIRQQDVHAIGRSGAGWRVVTRDGAELRASAVVIATGHRPPDDPLGGRWQGSRARLIADPWASLALAAIAPDEPVAILGTGLTAIDVLLTLARPERTAPITALSRRGLLPAAHASAAVPATATTTWIEAMLSRPGALSTRTLVRELRARVDEHVRGGGDWRAVIDALRPHTAPIWRALSQAEAARWLRHVRPFWEVHRHRMAPAVAAIVHRSQAAGTFRALAARVTSAHGTPSGVELLVRRRGASAPEPISVAWVVNCTGPGVDARTRPEPVIVSLVENGHLRPDGLGLGVLTGSRGEAIGADGKQQSDLVVVGTLRKPQLWESTAVPELRGQAAEAAAAILAHCSAAAQRERLHRDRRQIV